MPATFSVRQEASTHNKLTDTVFLPEQFGTKSLILRRMVKKFITSRAHWNMPMYFKKIESKLCDVLHYDPSTEKLFCAFYAFCAS